MAKERFFIEFMRDIIFGVEDGLVSILGLVIGVAAATSSTSAILVAASAGAVAAAISMSAGDYLSTKSQLEVAQSKKDKRLLKHIHPLGSAAVIGGCFLLVSTIPIAPYIIFDVKTASIISPIITFLALFILGAAKTTITKRNWFKSGIEMVIVAGIAALAGYLVGTLFPLAGF